MDERKGDDLRRLNADFTSHKKLHHFLQVGESVISRRLKCVVGRDGGVRLHPLQQPHNPGN